MEPQGIYFMGCLRIVKIFALVLGLSTLGFSQDEIEDENSGTYTAKYTNFNVSSVPAFVLLDVTANKVQQAGYSRSIKIDWTLKNYKNTPNVGLELQPLWLLLYNRGDLKKYRNATDFERTLSTLSVSIGTYNQDFWRQIAWALKINLYQEVDPLLNPSLDEVLGDFQSEKKQYMAIIEDLKIKIKNEKSEAAVKSLKKKMYLYKDSLFNSEEKQIELNKIYKQEFQKDHWNVPSVDFGIGRLKIYDVQNVPDSSKPIIRGFGMWLSGSKGIGYRCLLSGIMRFQSYSDNRVKFLMGSSLRYGNPRYNLYAEYSYDFANNYYFESERIVEKSTLGIGGDFKINSIIQLNLGLNINLDQRFNFVSLLPAANIICLMNL
ncbi:MAG: hypothetical protein HOP11_10035 [Saprospiraceae bacterium]|nr:hypothetical protein [Saprospiraceae bacterium]